MTEVRLFDIQRCSLVDGPGIRTTVFFKGCSLRCRWCHNPESQSPHPQLMIHKKRCTGCGRCLAVCPNRLEKCDLCGKCADFCPSGARELVGKTETTDEVFSEIIKDMPFYTGSDGGVTFSGGECMLQTEALVELAKKCKEKGIHTAVDTAGSVDRKHFEAVLPYTDLFLYDIKCFHEQTHKENTGVSNKVILENLAWLSKTAPEKVFVRIPVIPGVNTSDTEMSGIANFLKNLGIMKVELLAYHRMGEHKYDDLDMPLRTYDVPAGEEMRRCREYFN